MKVYFGYIEFGELVVSGDLYPVALVHDVHRIEDVKDEKEAQDIYETMDDNWRGAYDYIIPELYQGEVYLTKGAAK
jgi:hypothetical protein